MVEVEVKYAHVSRIVRVPNGTDDEIALSAAERYKLRNPQNYKIVRMEHELWLTAKSEEELVSDATEK